MKAFVMTDLEGVSGIVGRSDGIGNRIEHIDEARRLLTGEVNATVEGLVSAGMDRVVVADGHGGSNSIIATEIHERAELLRCSGELFPVAWTLADGYDVAVQIGAHAMMGTRDGFLHHSFNSHAITGIALNGRSIGEIGINALLAAAYGTPTVLVSGDRAACREAEELNNAITTVETKRGLNRYSSVDRSPSAVRSDLTAAAARACADRERWRVPDLEPTLELRVHFMCPNLADSYEKRGAKRLDFLTVSLEGTDIVDLCAQRLGWGPGVFEPYRDGGS